jgi:hypothetical protein
MELESLSSIPHRLEKFLEKLDKDISFAQAAIDELFDRGTPY